MTERLLVDVDEAARQLSVSRRFLEDRLYSGALPSVKVGRRRLIATADLVAYVDRLREEAAESAGPSLEVVAR